MNTDYIKIDGANGKFFVYAPHKLDKPHSIFVVVPGLAEHAARYKRLSEFLNAQNIALYAIDHIGQGPHAETLGMWPENGFNACVSNIDSLIQYLKEASEAPIILLGHSMGSFMSLTYIEQYSNRVNACILSGTNDKQSSLILGAGRSIAAIQNMFVGRNKRSSILNTLSFGQFNNAFKPNRTEFDWLSSDETEVDKYIADPHCGYVPTVGLFSDLFEALSKIYAQEEINKIDKSLPIHLLCGSKDPVGGNSKGPKALLERLKDAHINTLSLKIFENYRHECLNELDKQMVMQHILDVCTDEFAVI